MNSSVEQLPLKKLLINHFYVGIIFTLFYIWVSPKVIATGYPGLAVLLLAEILVLSPLVYGHLIWVSRKKGYGMAIGKLVPYQEKIGVKRFLLWAIGGIILCLTIYIPLYPLGLFFRESVFSWLPEWYFNPSFGTNDTSLLAKLFLIGILIDGLIGPIAEELFFRGYLLPRMAYLKKWAPILNGVFFGIYHFWQPHNLIASICVGIIFSYAVWKTKNIYVGIAIHCGLNILGSFSGYLAASQGILIGR